MAAGAAAGATGAYGAGKLYNYLTDGHSTTTMAPIKKYNKRVTKRKLVYRRFRKVARRMPKRRYKRRYRRRGDSFGRNLRKTKKARFNMRLYRQPNLYRRGCDYVPLATISPPTDASGVSPVAKYHSLELGIASCPNLTALLGNTFGKFQKFKIDRVTVKVVCINARRLAMEPNYKSPDGTGITGEFTMLHEEEYAKKNSYVFHYRIDNDNIDDGPFYDWSNFQFARPGTIEYCSFFRGKGKMFKVPISTTKRTQIQTGLGQDTFINKDETGVPMGWLDRNIANREHINICKAGIIVPGMNKKGWDGTTDNPIPILEVSARVCWSVKECGFAADQI